MWEGTTTRSMVEGNLNGSGGWGLSWMIQLRKKRLTLRLRLVVVIELVGEVLIVVMKIKRELLILRQLRTAIVETEACT